MTFPEQTLPVSSHPAAGRPRDRRSISIRVGLIALVVACALPATLVAARAGYEADELRQTRIYETTILTARSLAADLDRELEGIGAGLRVLAGSSDLAHDDLASFHARAVEALKYQDVDRYVLTDPAGNEVLDTSFAHHGSLPPHARLPTLSQVSSGGSHPLVARLEASANRPGTTIIVGVPVMIGDTARYLLFADLGSDRLGAIMDREALNQGWVAALLDRDAVIIARTRDAARFVGQPAVPALAGAMDRRVVNITDDAPVTVHELAQHAGDPIEGSAEPLVHPWSGRMDGSLARELGFEPTVPTIRAAAREGIL